MKWSVPRIWEGQTAFVVAGGPSLRGFDFSLLRGRRVVVVNTSCYDVPDADFLVFSDYRWWSNNQERARREFRGKVVALTPVHRDYDDSFLILDRQRSSGVSTDPTRLAWFHTTLTTALNLVGLLGSPVVGLLGADGKDAKDGASWHHEPHPPKWGNNPLRYVYHKKALEKIRDPLSAMGCKVFNLNRDSTYDCFQFADIGDLL